MQPAAVASSRSTSPCRAAAPTAPSPGACSTACSRTSASRSRHQRDQRRRHERRGAGLRHVVGGRDGARAGARRISGGASATPRGSARCSPRLSTALIGTTSLDIRRPSWRSTCMTRLLSPYQLNPLNFNPLRAVLEQSSTSSGCGPDAARSSCSSPPPTCAPARCKVFTRTRSRVDVRAGLGLPAVHVPGRRDRRRALLGRRLHGQSGDLPADLRLRSARRGDRPHQSDRATGRADDRDARS